MFSGDRNGGPPAATTQQHQKPGADPLADFVSVVLADTEDTCISLCLHLETKDHA
jgi:hypothetical protein